MKNKRIFIFILSQLIIVPSSFAKDNPFAIEEATIKSIQYAFTHEQITCEELIKIYLVRIQKYNLNIANAAPLNAFTQINVNVIDQARKLDQLYSQTKKLSGPLHCIPIILKDNLDSYDSSSSAGTLALLGNQPNQDAFLVAELRKAGAIIFGKGGMDELASGMFGISSRNGRMGNVYDTAKNPGGSSGGPAIAVSANFVMVGIGTDNSGSVRVPAAFNGIYGLRPSTGLISQRGVFPAGNLDGTSGPLTRSVEDLAILLDVIAKKDSYDRKTFEVPRVKTYTAFLDKNGLNGKRIGIVTSVGDIDTFKDMSDEIQQMYHDFYNKLKQLGATTIEIKLPEYNNNRKQNMAGMREDVDAYLHSYPAVRKNFQDICESDRTSIYGNVKKCLQFIKVMPDKFGSDYNKALQMFNFNKLYVEKIMMDHHLDALLLPISTTGVATYNAYRVNTWRAPVASNAGLPAITINIGYYEQMPVGVELVAKQFNEGLLIAMAYSWETHNRPRILPKMLENTSSQTINISAYNNFLNLIGYNSFMEILKDSKSDHWPTDLTGDKFREIVNRARSSL